MMREMILIGMKKTLRITMNDLPPEMQKYVELLLSHGGVWVYFLAGIAMLIEYVFPIFPGDVAIFAAGFVSGDSRSNLIIVLISAYIGSAIGFTLVYLAGKHYGRRIIASEKIRYINRRLLERTESWYKKYGSKLLIVSKYLPGIRFALVFFSGVADMDFRKVFVYTSISCLIWNSMVILLAYYLQQNIGEVYEVLTTYSSVVLYILIGIAIIWSARWFYLRRRKA